MIINLNVNMNNEIHWCTWKVLLEIVDHNNGKNAWEKYDNGFVMHEYPSKMVQAKFYLKSSTKTLVL